MSAHLSVTIDKDFCYQVINDEVFRLQTIGRDLIGIEMELLAMGARHDPDVPEVPALIPFFASQPHEKGLREILREVSLADGWQDDHTGGETFTPAALKIVLPDGDRLTFEPGGQIEYSSQPYTNLDTAVSQIKTKQKKLISALAQKGVQVFSLGINPWYTVEEIGLQVPKPEYLRMDSYFATRSPPSEGRRMMRQTCTNQINLDFGADTQTLAKRFLAANLIAPYACAIFSNSAIWDRNKQGMVGFRSAIWQKTDPSRTGFPDLTTVCRDLTKEACVRSYFDFAMQADVIHPQVRRMSFATWLQEGIAGVYPTAANFAAHLYTLFPEVRPRGYLEIRSIDGQALVWQFVPAAFYAGIIYDDANLDLVIATLATDVGRLSQLMAAATHGLQEKELQNRARWLMELAFKGGDYGVKKDLRTFYEHFTLNNKTPAADVQTIVKKAGKDYLRVADLLKLEESWQRGLES